MTADNGLHNLPGLPLGEFAIRSGGIMAATDEFNITITGKGGHAAMPQGTVNGTVLNCLNNGTSQIGGEIISPTGSTATWTGPGIGIVNASVVTVTQPGIYTFTISAPNGCVRPFRATLAAHLPGFPADC